MPVHGQLLHPSPHWQYDTTVWRPDLERRHAGNKNMLTQNTNSDQKATNPLKQISASVACTLAASLDRQTANALSPGAKQALWEALCAQERDSFRLALLLLPESLYIMCIGGEMALAALGHQLLNAEIGEHPPIGIQISGRLSRRHVHSLIDIPNLHTLDLTHCHADEGVIRALRQALECSLHSIRSLSLPKFIEAPKSSLHPPWPKFLLKLQSPVSPGPQWSKTPQLLRSFEDARYRLLVNLPDSGITSGESSPWRTYYRVSIQGTETNKPEHSIIRTTLQVKAKALMTAPQGGLASYLKRKYGIEKMSGLKQNRLKDEPVSREPKLPKLDRVNSSFEDSQPSELEADDASQTKVAHAADDPLVNFDETKVGESQSERHALADPLAGPSIDDTESTEQWETYKPIDFGFINRHKINPANYWDGIDRSNGFEQRVRKVHSTSADV